MNNKYLFLLVGLVAGVGIFAVSVLPGRVQTGKDFAGGIVPSQLWNANVSTQSVTPISGLLNLLLSGSISVGGTSATNQITTVYTATTSYPASTAVNLGPITASSSATSTSFSFTAPGFSVGDSCEISYNGATTTSAFGADGFITAVNTTTNQNTTTATFWNGSTATSTLTVTSTITGASSTLKATCFHTGV